MRHIFESAAGAAARRLRSSLSARFFSFSSFFRFSARPLAGAAVLACAALGGCGSVSNVSAAGQPDTFTVSASATGGRLAWARAHRLAMSEATDYCAHRGMQPSFADERTDGVEAWQQHESVLRFACHPKF